MTNYTVIAYRANYTDMCKGCVMGRSDSDHDILFFKSIEDAAVAAARYSIKNYDQDDEFDDWEITLLVDGINSEQWEMERTSLCKENDPFEAFSDLKRKFVDEELERRRLETMLREEALEAEKRRKASEELIAKELAEREQLRELLEKYPEEAQ